MAGPNPPLTQVATRVILDLSAWLRLASESKLSRYGRSRPSLSSFDAFATMTTYRWLTGDEIADWVNPECARRGWIQFNVNEQFPTCRVMGAFDGPALIAFFGMSLLPVLGPMWVDSDHRDGAASHALAQKMAEFMMEAGARGAMMIADSPVSARMAERFDMKRVENPVYEYVRK
jgi:hypothetical protein